MAVELLGPPPPASQYGKTKLSGPLEDTGSFPLLGPSWALGHLSLFTWLPPGHLGKLSSGNSSPPPPRSHNTLGTALNVIIRLTSGAQYLLRE